MTGPQRGFCSTKKHFQKRRVCGQPHPTKNTQGVHLQIKQALPVSPFHHAYRGHAGYFAGDVRLLRNLNNISFIVFPKNGLSMNNCQVTSLKYSDKTRQNIYKLIRHFASWFVILSSWLSEEEANIF